MLYCHGGSFYKEVTPGHWSFAAQVARSTRLDVLMPIYPLVPRSPATAEKHAEGFVDIFRLYPHPIVCLGGDSAGDTMATATMYRLLVVAPDHAARVRALVLISPLLDCALDHPELRRLEKTDPWPVADSLRSVMRLWATDLPMAHFRVSPLHGDVSRLPPLLLLCGTSDMLCADARRLSAKFHGKDASEGIAGSADLDKFTYIEAKDMLHVYALLPHWEGAQAREVIVH